MNIHINLSMKVLSLFLFISLSLSVFAQTKGMDEKQRREFEAQKISFFTQSLELTAVEAGLFWPLYQEMHTTVHQLEKERRVGWKKLAMRKSSSSEITHEMNRLFELEKQIITTKQLYYQKLLTVIPSEKLCRLELTELHFHRQLFNKLKGDTTSCVKKK